MKKTNIIEKQIEDNNNEKLISALEEKVRKSNVIENKNNPKIFYQPNNQN